MIFVLSERISARSIWISESMPELSCPNNRAELKTTVSANTRPKDIFVRIKVLLLDNKVCCEFLRRTALKPPSEDRVPHADPLRPPVLRETLGFPQILEIRLLSSPPQSPAQSWRATG